MSETKHTPGPWRISGESATIIVQADHRAKKSKDGLLIASAHGYPDSRYMPSDDEAAANALLIAAAPELLEALESLIANVYSCACTMPIKEEREAWDKADAAIAKAKGEAL